MKVEVGSSWAPRPLYIYIYIIIVCTVSLEVNQHWTRTRYQYFLVLASKHRLSISVYVLANKPRFFSSQISWEALLRDIEYPAVTRHAPLPTMKRRRTKKEKKKWWVGWGMKQCSHDIIKFRRLYAQICLTSYDTIYFAGSARIWCGTAVDSVTVHLHRRGPVF